MTDLKMTFEKCGTPIGELRGKRRKRSFSPADHAEAPEGDEPALPESMRARAGAEAGRRRASEGRMRKEMKRQERAMSDGGGGVKPPRVKPVAPVRGPNSKDVEQWFREGIWALFGRKFLLPAWPASCGQRSLSLKLLENYGPDLTKRTIMLFCQSWDRIVRESGGRLSGAPTVNLLWAMRERIFAEAQTQDRKPDAAPKSRGRDSDEFREDDSGPSLGWG